jgi:hypothetical protein
MGAEMTNESIKILLILVLLGSIRTAIFFSEMPTSRSHLGYEMLLAWLTALVWPVMPARAMRRRPKAGSLEPLS